MIHGSTSNPADVTIIGAGWAGLAAAVALSAQGYRIELIESTAHIGGRARRIDSAIGQLDNGQHLLLGAYRELLGLLHILGVPESQLFIRTPLNLHMSCMHGQGLQIAAGKLPSPLHMLSALLSARGLSLAEKWSMIRCWTGMLISGFRTDPDISVADYLSGQHQGDRLVRLFWRPICIAALNTDIDKASMQVFLNVLRRSFSGSRSNSDMLLPRACIDSVLPRPAIEFIERNHGSVRTGERLRKINSDGQRVTDIETSNGNHVVSRLILATPYQQTGTLLATLPQFSAISTALSTFEHEPITTLYMQFPAHIHFDGYMRGLCDGIGQWFIDRRSCGQPGLIATVISASGSHEQMDRETLTQTILGEIAALFPDWPAPTSTFLVREKRATFSCTPAAVKARPATGHIGHNIWLAGDYTDTGLPATLEGAVASGLQCARQLIDSFSKTG